MKRTFLLLLVLLFLISLYIGMTKRKKSKDSSIVIEDREFIVDDYKQIDIITVESPAYPLKHFTRVGDDWFLNNKSKVEPNVIKNMLMVLSKMRINYIPPKSSIPSIRKGFKEVGMTIKAFGKKGELLSGFVMGSNTQAEDATYCIKIGAQQPYAMSIPVYDGGLRAYFNQLNENIIDKTVFEIDYNDITSIKIDYKKAESSSFEIEKKNGSFDFSTKDNRLKNKQINENLISSYFKDFDKLSAEVIRTGHPTMDSIAQFLPFAELEISLKNKAPIQLKFFPIDDLLDERKNTKDVSDVYSVERHIVLDNNGEAYVVQQRMLRDIFRSSDYFFQK